MKPDERTHNLFNLLKQCAAQGVTLTYTEVEHRTGIHKQDFSQLTYILENVLLPQGLPRLDALVVRRDTRIPGEGFWVREAQPDPDLRLLRWMELRDEVFAYDWSDIELPESTQREGNPSRE